MTRLFNAYVMVGWSAGSKPATGKDSVWIGVLKPDARFRLQFEAHNPATRDEAIARSVRALQDTVLLGLTTNARYLARVLRHPEFMEGRSDTGMLARCAEELRGTVSEEDTDLAIAAAVLSDRELLRAVRSVPAMHAAMGAWRN